MMVCDAEAHIYELLEVLRQRQLEYVIRAADYRSFTPEGQALFEAVAQQAVQERFRLPLKRRPDQEARTAHQARITPDAPCTVALQPSEWQALYLFTHKQRRLPTPTQPPSLHQAARWIAQLGRVLGRTGDGEPGVKVLWRGWTRLQDIAATFTLLQSPQDVGNA